MQETQVQPLDREDPLKKEMATYSSIPAWRIPWTEEPGRLQSMGLQESDTTWRLNHHYQTGSLTWMGDGFMDMKWYDAFTYMGKLIQLYILNVTFILCQLYFSKAIKMSKLY